MKVEFVENTSPGLCLGPSGIRLLVRSGFGNSS